MDKTYQPAKIEESWYRFWEEQGYFASAENLDTAHYCIMLPPPNVTGYLHMGHAFQQTLMDALVRYQRMKGSNTLWQCGTDHAGIATQMVVERQLEAKGQSRSTLGREKFTQTVWDWKQQSGGKITRQSRRLGTSMDWSRERFTMDEGLSEAVIKAFVDLYDEGLIYRGKRLVNWDPVLQTAISDLEVVSEEEDGTMYYVRYLLINDEKNSVVVGTTRPETILADGAIAVHPDDERYQHLIGRKVWVPLTEPQREIAIIADTYVTPEFGTGCVKITPAHDFNDYQVYQRHEDKNILLIELLTLDAKMNENVPPAYRGLDRYVARERIVNDLEQASLLVRRESHRYKLPRCDRSGVVVEPMLTDQWYVKIAPLAEPAIAAVTTGQIRFIPDNWKNTYFEWMRNIKDWCISRQLWWGHRIPAWYDDKGVCYVGVDESAVRKKYNLTDSHVLQQDPDVLDTWFSSALWPFSTLGWPNDTRYLSKFYPTNVLVTGFDIIFFWVARMIIMGLKLTGNIPFREVYIHGLVRDYEGRKMSKSNGNILDPLDLIDGIELADLVKKRQYGLMQPQYADAIETATRSQFPQGIRAYGTDALRFTFAALATQGRDIRFDTGRIEGYRNFCNKMWNATRYVLMCVEKQPISLDGKIQLGLADKWIRARLAQRLFKVESGFKGYRFDWVSQAIYEFIWNDYCDWYLEFSKSVLVDQHASEQLKRGTLITLIEVLEICFRMAHPLIPFLTEELWHKIVAILPTGKEVNTIMLQPYPLAEEADIDQQVLAEMQWLQTLIMGIRKLRAGHGIAPAKQADIRVKGGSRDEQDWLNRNTLAIQSLARVKTITVARDGTFDETAALLVGTMTVDVSLEDLIDTEAELKRLQKEINKLEKEKQSLQLKLKNENFISQAPHEVVEKTNHRLLAATNRLERLAQQADKIQARQA